MLPLRVELEGFLTYRDRTVFDFQGEWLWAITGKNGAGKSAIFDAITYALYGEHRGGKQHDDQLISQGRDAACVVFEFALGPEIYRVQRTITRQYARRKITYDRTCQAYQLVCTGDAGVATPLALPGTDRKDGLEAWVVRTIGLTHGAFVSSVLLQQGRADRFVLAKPRERRDILMELLDLEIYKRLETAARAHQRRCADQISDLEAQLHRLTGATPEAVAEAQTQAQALQEQAKRTEQAVQAATTTLANARLFNELDGELRTARRELERAELLLQDADTIEREAADLRTVRDTVPLLGEIVQHRRRETELRNAAAGPRRQAEAIDVKALAAEQQAREAAAAGAEQAYGQARDAASTARRDAEVLQPLAEAGQELARLQAELLAADTELEDLCRDLIGHDAAIEHEERCTAADRALQPLKELRRQRTLAGEAEGRRRRAEERLPELKATALALVEQALEARRQAGEVAQQIQHLRVEHAEARTRQTAAETDLGERLAAKDEGTCSRCGQRVDADHIRREIADAEQAVRDASDQADDLARRIDEQERAAGELAATATDLEGQRDGAREAVAAAERTIETERGKRDEALRVAEQAIEALTTPYRDLADDEPYPTEQELREVEQLARDLKAASGERRRLDRLAERAALLNGQSDKKRQQLDAVQGRYPDADLGAAMVNYQALLECIATLQEQETAAWTAWQEARVEAERAAGAAREATERRAALLGDAAARDAEAAAEERAATALQGSLPLDWRTVAPTEGQALDALRRRESELAGAEERKAELDAARLQRHALESQVRTLTQNMTIIPEGDRVPVEEAQQRLARLQEEHARQKEESKKAESHATTLANRLQQRVDLERRCDEQCRRRDDYKNLVDLLGRDGLQAWLVQEAQADIGYVANEFLAGISEGTLRLIMQPHGDDLEILVSDYSSGDAPMDIAFISGSQRFRAAVALALAIGRYSGSGSRLIRSVIIDEGFGSLDAGGRREMIDQLKTLHGTLDRVILVSHQEEFHDAFPNGYHIEKREGVSRAILREAHVEEMQRELVGAV